MTLQQRVARYELGAMTGHELVIDCLTRVDTSDPAATLSHLPSDTYPRLREFLDHYQPGEMLARHQTAIPTPEQVLAAKRWFEGLKNDEAENEGVDGKEGHGIVPRSGISS